MTSSNFQIGRGDTVPAPAWELDFDPAMGDDFELAISVTGRTNIMLRVGRGELSLASRIVTWSPTSLQTMTLPLDVKCPYIFRYLAASGSIQILNSGNVTAIDGVVTEGHAIAVTAASKGDKGDKGDTGSRGPTGSAGSGPSKASIWAGRRGVSIGNTINPIYSGSDYHSTAPWANWNGHLPDVLAQYKSVGFDFVRLAFDPGPLCAASGSHRDDLMNLICHQYADDILQVGMCGIIDFHVNYSDPFSLGWSAPNLTVDTTSAAFATYLDVLNLAAETVANYYKPEQMCIELFNEPPSPQDWSLRSPVPNVPWDSQAQLMVASIRDKAPNHTIIVPGTNYSSTDALMATIDPANYDDLVLFNSHLYEPDLVAIQADISNHPRKYIHRLRWRSLYGEYAAQVAAMEAAVQADDGIYRYDASGNLIPGDLQASKDYWKAQITTYLSYIFSDWAAPFPSAFRNRNYAADLRRWAITKGVEDRLIATEFGCIGDDSANSPNAATELTRMTLMQQRRIQYEENGVRWCVWAHEQPFSLKDETATINVGGTDYPAPQLVKDRYIVSLGMTGRSPYDTDAAAVFATANWARASEKLKSIFNEGIIQLKEAGIFTTLDVFLCFLTDERSQYLVNLADPTTVCVENGTMLFTPISKGAGGVRSDGYTGYLSLDKAFVNLTTSRFNYGEYRLDDGTPDTDHLYGIVSDTHGRFACSRERTLYGYLGGNGLALQTSLPHSYYVANGDACVNRGADDHWEYYTGGWRETDHTVSEAVDGTGGVIDSTVRPQFFKYNGGDTPPFFVRKLGGFAYMGANLSDDLIATRRQILDWWAAQLGYDHIV